jgi:predicted dehydrogenase
MEDLNQPLRVAIVGCGKIADDHLKQIQRIPQCTVVGACDREPLMARQLCERFGIPHAFSDVAALLKDCRPDVVHITTPPQGHYQLGRQCLEAGCHVYVEKPFTVTADETEDLLAMAERTQRKVTVGHDLQFSHVARRARQLVSEGCLGGPPVHIESYYCYDLSDARFAAAMLADKNHWVRKLPGGLLHNVISHGIARIAEYLVTDTPQVYAHGFVSPLLKSLGEQRIIDELRVIIVEEGRTAYFTFSSQMHPGLNHLRLYGAKHGLELDEDHQTVIRRRGTPYTSYAEKFIPPVNLAGQYLGNLGSSLRKFFGNDFHMKSGMKCLIELFYQAIAQGAPVPIPYRQIRLTARLMDEIFRQLDSARSHEVSTQPD